MIAKVARFFVSAALLFLLSRFIDVGDVVGRLRELHLGWIALALAISVLQVLALAWRWVYTAAQLGIDLSFRTALGEYYLGLLLNQLLPGGITGDVSRAWRHASGAAPTRPAVTAVVLERASTQLVMTTVAIISLFTLPWASPWMRAALGFTIGVAVWFLVRTIIGKPQDARTGGLRADVRKALFGGDARVLQWVSAALVVASYIAVFLVAARAVGVVTPLLRLLPLVAPVLMTMLIPVTLAGWGIREAAAAALWGLVGLTPADGATISVTYGLVVLTSSLPGILVLTLPGSRGRTGHPPPA